MREEVSFPGLWLYQTVIRKDFKFKFSQMLCRGKLVSVDSLRHERGRRI